MAKCYVRNGVRGWSPQRQIEALGDLWDEDASFRDTLKADRAKAPGRIRPEWLTERAAMLRPSGRKQDTIHVATLLALAVDEAELVADVLPAAMKRNATIIAADSGFQVPPDGDGAVWSKAVKDWQRADKDARTDPWRLAGVQAAAEKKRRETLRKIKVARPLWRDTSPKRLSTDQVAEQSGLSPKTLYQELGRRPRIRKGKADVGED